MLVELNSVLGKCIALYECAQQASLLGIQNTAQTAVRIHLVANKTEPFDFGQTALKDFKHKINTVVRATNNTWSDCRGETTLLRIRCRDLCGVTLCGTRVKHAARLALHDCRQIVVLQAAVAFKIDLVDRWVFSYFDHKTAALWFDVNAFEQTAFLQTLKRAVQIRARNALTTSDSRIRQNSRWFDALVAFDRNRVEAKLLRLSDARQSDVSH